MNNNLIIFKKDGTKDGMAFSTSTTEPKAMEFYKLHNPQCEQSILKYFFIRNDKTPIAVYMNHYTLTDELKLTMDLTRYTKSKRVEEFRKKRDVLISKLDIPFMRSLEDEDPTIKNHIIKLKDFLRGIPEDKRFLELTDQNEILKYNPFGNIFEVIVLSQGEGYSSPPKVVIDPPRGESFGFSAEGVAFINGGKVTRVEITYPGSAYDYLPKIKIDPPEQGEPAVVISGYPQNIMVAQEDIEENTIKYYP